MVIFLIKRLAGFLVTAVAATLVVFVVLEVLPGDPAVTMLGVEARPESVRLLHAELGLDRPAPLRYLAWIGGLVAGGLRRWFSYHVAGARPGGGGLAPPPPPPPLPPGRS